MSEASDKLISDVKAYFNKRVNTDAKFRALYLKKREGKARYKDAYKFAEMVGDTLSEALKKYVTWDVYDNKELYQEIARSILEPVLGAGHSEIVDFAKVVQEAQYEAMGLGLKAVAPEMNRDKLNGLSEKLRGSETYDEALTWMGEPITNYNMTALDEFIRQNADFQYDVGFTPVVVRTNVGGCCEWCQGLSGAYDYEEVSEAGNDVWKRHERCRCTIDIRTEEGGAFQRMRTSGRAFIG